MNKRLVIIIGIVCLIIISVIIFGGIFKQADEGDSTTITDRDTGETISLEQDTSVIAGAAGDNLTSDTIVLGLDSVTNILGDVSGKYTSYLQTAFITFSKDRLNGAFSTITIRPQETTRDGLVVTTGLRLGQGNEILPVTIRVSNGNDSLIVHISDPEEKHGGEYVYIGGMTKDGLLYSIDYTKNYKTSTDPIIVTLDAPESYREAALDYIRELGFSPAEFTIKFTNYENPFK